MLPGQHHHQRRCRHHFNAAGVHAAPVPHAGGGGLGSDHRRCAEGAVLSRGVECLSDGGPLARSVLASEELPRRPRTRLTLPPCPCPPPRQRRAGGPGGHYRRLRVPRHLGRHDHRLCGRGRLLWRLQARAAPLPGAACAPLFFDKQLPCEGSMGGGAAAGGRARVELPSNASAQPCCLGGHSASAPLPHPLADRRPSGRHRRARGRRGLGHAGLRRLCLAQHGGRLVWPAPGGRRPGARAQHLQQSLQQRWQPSCRGGSRGDEARPSRGMGRWRWPLRAAQHQRPHAFKASTSLPPPPMHRSAPTASSWGEGATCWRRT